MGWKMVRDNHRHLFEGFISGSWRTSQDPVSSLIKKLGEEYSELVENRDPAELYDLIDVLCELTTLMDPDLAAAEAHAAKQERLGFFGSHLEWHPWSGAGGHEDPDLAGLAMAEQAGGEP